MTHSFENQPIQRDDALAPFSRDHYVGLVHAHRLIKSAEKDRAAKHAALADFLDAWSSEIQPHFRDEERLLQELLSPEDRQRLLDEHAHLTDLASEARRWRRDVDPDGASLAALGRTLEQHIRWEERELFNRVQQTVSEPQRAALAAETAEIESSRPRNAGARGGDSQQRTQ